MIATFFLSKLRREGWAWNHPFHSTGDRPVFAMIHRVGRRTDPIYSSAPADCKRYLNGYGMISRITVAFAFW